MERTLIKETLKYIEQKLKVCGWVSAIRSHGKILFVDLRDRTGLLQVVFTPHQSKHGTGQAPKNEKLYELSQKLRPEWVISVEGEIKERPKAMVNPKIETGKIELAPVC